MTKRTPQQLRRLKRQKRMSDAKFAARERDNNICQYCGLPAYSVHHIVKLSQGGTDDLTNLITLCWMEGCRAHDRCHHLIKGEALHIECVDGRFLFSEVKL